METFSPKLPLDSYKTNNILYPHMGDIPIIGKMAFKPKNDKERILHRLKIARGHLNKVAHMIEEDKYCIEVLTQSQAVQSSLKRVDTLLLENHLKHCMVDAIQRGNIDQTVTEVISVFRKGNKYQ